MSEDPLDQLGRSSVQAITLAVQLLEAYEQRRARLAADREATDRTSEGRRRAEALVERARAQAVVGPATEQLAGRGTWATTASHHDLVRVWAQGVNFQNEDVVRLVEDELSRRAPETMRRYRADRGRGASHVDAMRGLSQDLYNELTGVRTAAPGPARTREEQPRSRDAAGPATRPPSPPHADRVPSPPAPRPSSTRAHNGQPTGPQTGRPSAAAAAQAAAAWVGAGPLRRPRGKGAPTVLDPAVRRDVTSGRAR